MKRKRILQVLMLTPLLLSACGKEVIEESMGQMAKDTTYQGQYESGDVISTLALDLAEEEAEEETAFPETKEVTGRKQTSISTSEAQKIVETMEEAFSNTFSAEGELSFELRIDMGDIFERVYGYEGNPKFGATGQGNITCITTDSGYGARRSVMYTVSLMDTYTNFYSDAITFQDGDELVGYVYSNDSGEWTEQKTRGDKLLEGHFNLIDPKIEGAARKFRAKEETDTQYVLTGRLSSEDIQGIFLSAGIGDIVETVGDKKFNATVELTINKETNLPDQVYINAVDADVSSLFNDTTGTLKTQVFDIYIRYTSFDAKSSISVPKEVLENLK